MPKARCEVVISRTRLTSNADADGLDADTGLALPPFTGASSVAEGHATPEPREPARDDIHAALDWEACDEDLPYPVPEEPVSPGRPKPSGVHDMVFLVDPPSTLHSLLERGVPVVEIQTIRPAVPKRRPR